MNVLPTLMMLWWLGPMMIHTLIPSLLLTPRTGSRPGCEIILDSLSDLDTLRHHALQQANFAHGQDILGRLVQRRSQALQRLFAADGGLHRASSNAFWTAAKLFDRQRSLTLQVRLNVLPTRHRISLWYPDCNPPHSCPLCSALKDTVGHRLGALACTLPLSGKYVPNMVILFSQ